MFVDEGGWGWPREPAPKRVLTERQGRLVLWLILANVLFLLVAPIGGSTIIEPMVMLFSKLH